MANDNIKNIEAEIALLRVRAQLLGEENKQQKTALAREADILDAQNQQQKILEAIVEEKRTATKSERELLAVQQARLDNIAEELKKEEEITKEVQKRTRQLEDAVKQAKELGSITANYISQLTTVDSTYKKTLLGSLMTSVLNARELIDALKQSEVTVKSLSMSLLKGVGGGLKMVAGTFLGTFEQMFFQVLQDSLSFQSEMVKATGRVEDFAGQAQVMQARMDGLAIGLSHTRETLMALNVGFGNFRNVGTEARKELEDTTTLLVALGVNADTAVGFMDGLTKTFGFSAKEASAIAKQFKGLSDTVKFTTEEMMNSFEAAQASLGVFGKDAKDIFGNIIKMADKTGVAYASLQGIADNFQQFSSGAKMVGDLNTALQGNFFNLEQMMEMNPDEQIQHIRDVIRARYGDIDALNKHQKFQIASAMGMSNTAEAMALLRNETKESTHALEQYGISQKQAEEATAAAAGPMAKMKFSFEQMMPKIMPFIDALMELVDGFAELVKGNEKLIFGFIAIGTALSTLAKFFVPVKAALNFIGVGAKVRGIGIAAEAKAMGALNAATGLLAETATVSAKPIAALGAALMSTAAPVALVIGAFTAFFAVLTFFALNAGPEAADAMLALAAAMGGLGLAMGGVALAGNYLLVSSKGALIGLGLVAVGLAAIGLALKLVSSDDLESLATIMENVGTVTNPFSDWSSGLGKFANAAEDAVEPITKFYGALALGTLFGNSEQIKGMVKVVTAVASIDKDNVEGLKEATAFLSEVKVVAQNAQIESLNALANTVKGLQKAKTAPLKIEVSLNGTVFKNAVAKVVNEKG